MNTDFTFYRTRGAGCPYLPDRISRIEFFEAENFPEDCYETLLAGGFRRSGKIFYRNICPGCAECRQMRIPVSRFKPSGSQARALRKNKDVGVTVVPAGFRQDVFALYRRYSVFKHGKDENEKNFREFLCDSPLDSRLTLYHAAGTLLAAGWVDVLPGGLSSVYFAFEPEAARRSPGVFSVVKEIELTKSMGLDYYYLGFIVESSPSMSYKAAYLPHQRLCAGRWINYAREEKPRAPSQSLS
jgi:arginine-tRNA-protein transferase